MTVYGFVDVRSLFVPYRCVEVTQLRDAPGLMVYRLGPGSSLLSNCVGFAETWT